MARHFILGFAWHTCYYATVLVSFESSFFSSSRVLECLNQVVLVLHLWYLYTDLRNLDRCLWLCGSAPPPPPAVDDATTLILPPRATAERFWLLCLEGEEEEEGWWMVLRLRSLEEEVELDLAARLVMAPTEARGAGGGLETDGGGGGVDV